MANNGLLYETSISDNIQGAQALPSIPREAILDTVPRSALAATKKIVNLVPITSGTVLSNQTVQFLIPQRNLAKASSFYLKFKCTTTGAGAAERYSFSGSIESAAALINNIQIQAGGIVLESLQNYHLWHNNVMSWAHSGEAELAVESLCSGAKMPSCTAGAIASNQFQTLTANGVYGQSGFGYSQNLTSVGGTVAAVGGAGYAGGATYNNNLQFVGNLNSAVFTIPILAGFFNPKEAQLVPLQFINGGVLVTITLNPVAKAFFMGTLSSISQFQLDDLELCYAEITPAPEYVLRVREEMMAGKMIKIEAQSYQQYLVACGSSIRQNFNVNLSSVAAIFWGRVIGPDTLTTTKCFVGYGQDNDPATRYEMYFDNVLLFNSANQLNSIAVQVRQLQEAFASTVTDYPISPYTAGRGNNATYATTNSVPDSGTIDNTFYTKNCLFGLSTKLFASNSTSMDGTPVGVMTLNFQQGYSNGGTTGVADSTSNLWYIYTVYDYIYLVDATGSVSKNQ